MKEVTREALVEFVTATTDAVAGLTEGLKQLEARLSPIEAALHRTADKVTLLLLERDAPVDTYSPGTDPVVKKLASRVSALEAELSQQKVERDIASWAECGACGGPLDAKVRQCCTKCLAGAGWTIAAPEAGCPSSLTTKEEPAASADRAALDERLAKASACLDLLDDRVDVLLGAVFRLRKDLERPTAQLPRDIELRTLHVESELIGLGYGDDQRRGVRDLRMSEIALRARDRARAARGL